MPKIYSNKDNHPITKASFISRIFFSWVFPILKHGRKNELQVEDLYGLLKEDESELLGNKLQELWVEESRNAQRSGHQPKYFKCLIAMHWKEVTIYGFALIFNEWIVRVAETVCLKKLICSFMQPSSIQERLTYGTGIILSNLIYALVLHFVSFGHQHIGMKCKVACCSLIYHKALKLSKSALNETTVGQMVNLMSNDANRFDRTIILLHYLYISPIQMAILIYFLWAVGEFGSSCLAGAGFVIFLTPIQYYMSTLLKVLRFKMARQTDRRAQKMNEIISAIRVIKMYTWEKPFTALVDNIRTAEISVLRKSTYIRALYLSLHESFSKVIIFLTLVTFILRGGVLKADTVFFMVTVFNTVLRMMVHMLPSGLTVVSELTVCLKRIQTFLMLEENKSSELLELKQFCSWNTMERHNSEIVMTNVIASWTSKKPTLNKLNVNLKGNKLVIVIGPVGSGKTSLLQALMGELVITDGHCKVSGAMVYNAQEPWIFPGNIKENILLGQPFNKERYSEVIYMSALEEDLKQLPFGENTVVGERGVALSGGQKARVNLARVLYRDADIYLLDDPLSAVDTEVSRHIYENCFLKQLKGKLRIFVTHQLQYLPKADHIIVLNSGRIAAQGTYPELLDQGNDFGSLICNEAESSVNPKNEKVTSLVREKEPSNGLVEKSCEKPSITAEQMVEGSVTWATYWDYLRSGNSLIGLIILASIYAVTQAFYSGSDCWLAHWVSRLQKINSSCNPYVDDTDVVHIGESPSNLQSISHKNETYFYSETSTGVIGTRFCGDFDTDFYVYTALAFVVVLLTNVRALLFFRYCVDISLSVHNQMLKSLIRAPTKFFDDNASGRILNRFTKDMCTVDEALPPIFFDVISKVLLIVGINVIVITSNYYILLPYIVLVLVLYHIRKFYIKTSRRIKRIEAVSTSPVLTHLAATVQGLTTIRSIGCENILLKQFNEFQDAHSSAWFMYISVNRWSAIWLELTAVIFLIVVIYCFILIAELKGSETDSSKVGLAISSAMNFSAIFQTATRRSAEAENLMTSVERTLEYSKIEPEEPTNFESGHELQNKWPEQGAIQFHNVFLTYGKKHVLKDLTFDIRPQEKIGIVGRTGAGKSSIVASLFRMFEPTGDIFIDDIRTSDIALHDLCQSISIIPQDPVLFSGTIRYNLDPLNQFKDDELWNVIEEIELKDSVPALDFQVSDCGSNFSVGEKQLICLARAILRQNRIIVMDEATANIDPSTEDHIRRAIRSKFSQCTIITIAHRLHSVMDCDRILVLDDGCLKEYGHPTVLLENPDGFLTSMVKHTKWVQ